MKEREIFEPHGFSWQRLDEYKRRNAEPAPSSRELISWGFGYAVVIVLLVAFLGTLG